MKSWRTDGMLWRATGPIADGSSGTSRVVRGGVLEDRLHAPPARGIAREEAHGHGVVAGRGQAHVLFRHLLGEEGVGDLQEDARAVTGTRVATSGAAVGEVGEDLQGLRDDGVGRLPVQRGHEAQAAGIVFERWVIQPLARG
jgi:hypothetical protein